MAWYVNANGTTFGPVDDAQVIEWIRTGRLFHGSICYVGSQQWADLASYPPFADALRMMAPPPPPVGAIVQAPFRPVAPKKPTDPGLKLALWIIGLVVLSFVSTWLGIVLAVPMLAHSEIGRRKNKPTFVSWVLGRPPSGAQAIASLVLGSVMFAGGAWHAITFYLHDLEAKRAAEAIAVARAKTVAELLAAVPAKITEWRAKLSQVQSDAESANYVEGGVTTVDAVTADITAVTGQLGSSTPPEVEQLKTDAAAVREKYAARTEFNTELLDIGQQVMSAKQQATARQWLSADESYANALKDLDSLGNAAPWLAKFLPTGFDIAAKKKEVAALRSQIAGPLTAEKQRQQKAAAARQAKEAKEAAYATLCGEKPAIGWGGDLIGVEYVLKETANDPDSIEVKNCTEPALSSDNCWLSTCDVRGKNAFGAKILKRMTFSKNALGFQQVSE